jgi:beta-lactamase regulating signal transducer with metallopeptidase domain
MISEKLLNLLISLSISGTVLFGIWMISRLLLKNRLSHRMFYYLLLIVLLRSIIPLTIEQSLVGRTFTLIESSPIYSAIYGPRGKQNPAVIVGDNVIIGNNVVMGTNNSNIAPYILYIWLIVAIGFFIQKITKYQSFSKYIKADWQSVDDPQILDLLSDIHEEKKITYPIDLYTSSLISSPLLLGIKKSYIVLPSVDLSEEQLYSILSHELTHFKNKDILYKWFMQFVLCIHWFNPAMYFIGKRVNQECEYACDEVTTRHFTKEHRYHYGKTLIEMTTLPGKYHEKIASITLYENTSEIKLRLDALLQNQKTNKPRYLTTSFVTVGLFFSAIILGAYPTSLSTWPTGDIISESPTDQTEPPSSDDKPLGRPFS